MSGDYMAEDPLCSFIPGKYLPEEISRLDGVEYGSASDKTIDWESAAAERMKRIPSFVRGMVVKKVESYCLEKGIEKVTLEELEEIRAKIPTQKLFAGSRDIS